MNLTVLPSEVRSTSGISPDFSPEGDGVQITVDVTETHGDKPLLTLALDKLADDGAYVPLASVSRTIPGETRITVAPEVRAFPIPANHAIHSEMPRAFRVRYYIEGGAFKFAVTGDVK